MNHASETATYILQLYVMGADPAGKRALNNIQAICDRHLRGDYALESIDIEYFPELAESEQILAVPTLVRKAPAPVRKILGDLSDTDRVLVGLDLPTSVPAPEQ